MTVAVRPGPTFAFDQPKRLFSTQAYVALNPVQSFDVSPDDKRFLFLRETAPNERNELIEVQNWTAEMKARARRSNALADAGALCGSRCWGRGGAPGTADGPLRPGRGPEPTRRALDSHLRQIKTLTFGRCGAAAPSVHSRRYSKQVARQHGGFLPGPTQARLVALRDTDRPRSSFRRSFNDGHASHVRRLARRG